LSPGIPAKVIASTMGLAAFVIAVVAGLSAENPVELILGRAMVSLCACYVVGLIAGLVAERAVTERIGEYMKTTAAEEAAAAAQESARMRRAAVPGEAQPAGA